MTHSENSALEVANSILEKSFIETDRISHMKLQKLLYIVHGWHLVVLDKPAFAEQVEAWKYGPVIASVYQEFKHWGNRDITELGEYQKLADKSQVMLYNIIAAVWKRYEKFSGVNLSSLTHQEGTPWVEARKANMWFIPNESIQKYYFNLIKDHYPSSVASNA